MSGTVVSEILRTHAETIHRSELERLRKKLQGLPEADRQLVEAVTADVIRAVVSMPARVLSESPFESDAEAIMRLFALEPGADR